MNTKKNYIIPTCDVYQLVQEKGILSLSNGSGSGSDMDTGDYGQNPF